MPRLLASTQASQYNQHNRQEALSGCGIGQSTENANFKNAQWTADGSCIITDSADNHIRTFIVPPDLLEDRDRELTLDSFAEIRSVGAVRALTTYPLFDLQNSATALVLCSIPDHPIQLHSALCSGLVASYPFVHAATEAFISPHVLVFDHGGDTFIAGSRNLIAAFDASRPGEGPFSLTSAAPGRNMSKKTASTGMKGIVSALSIEPASRILAAGTFSRHVGLYGSGGQGECLGVFRVNQNLADSSIGGRGITQLLWSPSGRYLYIAERHSRGVMVYDIRKTGQLLSWAEERNAESNQRLGIDVSGSLNGDDTLEIWGGGLDGKVRIWRNTHCQEGPQQPEAGWQAHDDAVSSTLVHRCGGVVASCSGQRHYAMSRSDACEDRPSSCEGLRDSTDIDRDNSLKIWSV